MSAELKLHRPWLVAVWPGMGHVAVSAGYYLMAKLGMHLVAEFSAPELFDVSHVEVKQGLIGSGHQPRNRFFVWHDPKQNHDILVFIGEAQPTTGKHLFCQKLIDYAKTLGVERVFTFAAMATQMHPGHASRVFVAATDQPSLDQLKQLDVTVLNEGHIGGLNGVLLGVAAENQLPGSCLLGEIPSMVAQLPFPKASLAVLKKYASLAEIDIDYDELQSQADVMDETLGEILSKVQRDLQHPEAVDEEAIFGTPSLQEEKLDPDEQRQIERLFQQASEDRSKAYELKRELDRLDVFDEYEDRFLDLFKKPE